MDLCMLLEQRLQNLRQHTEPAVSQFQELVDEHTERQSIDRCFRDPSHNACMPSSLENPWAAVRWQIVRHRRIQTTTSRVVEVDVREIIGIHPLPALAMRMILEKVHVLFLCVRQRQPGLVSEIDLTQLQQSCLEGNQRQHFNVIRSLLGPIRCLLRHLCESDQAAGGSLLQELGQLGVVVPSKVISLVKNAASGDTDEMLAPPEYLRDVWISAGKERVAPKDCGRHGDLTKLLWRTHWRVRDCHVPPVSAFELKGLFGDDATIASHSDLRSPYESGANRYTLNGKDPFVVECTKNGLFTASGPSGTAYRYLNLWLVLGGSQEKLPEVQFAMAAMILGGVHHPLIEVMAVCASILGQEVPESLEGMLKQLVPRDLELESGGVSCCITPHAFQQELGARLQRRLA